MTHSKIAIQETLSRHAYMWSRDGSTFREILGYGKIPGLGDG